MAGRIELGLHGSSLVSRILSMVCSIESTEVGILTSVSGLGLEENHKFFEAHKPWKLYSQKPHLGAISGYQELWEVS